MQAPQEMQVRSLVREGPMKKGMATHSSVLAWEIPWTEEPGGLQSMGSQGRTRLKQLINSSHSRASQVAKVVKNLSANTADTEEMGLIPELGRFPGG